VKLATRLTVVCIGLTVFLLCGQAPGSQTGQPDPNRILLKDYRPVSIYKIPVTRMTAARYRVIDVHTHSWAKTAADVDRWVKTMDEVGIEKSVVLTGAIGSKFESVKALYSRYPSRFEFWCGFDYTGFDKPGYGPAAIAELERCVKLGARGVGEEGDKGKGLGWGKAAGMHLDDPRMDSLLEKCAELKIPISIHAADPIWMYQKMDASNDGLMNALAWRLDNQPGIVGHSGMIDILERAVTRHPRTTFVACHFANLAYDLTRLGQLFDRYPNLQADISARYAETATIPRFAANFYGKYQDRLVYGTDMGFSLDMYRTTFRILETADEHFYAPMFGYHWSYSGLALPDNILKKVYRENALRVVKQ
jgi:predicted TIM-barrel fold metal-dependent hydrolase